MKMEYFLFYFALQLLKKCVQFLYY